MSNNKMTFSRQLSVIAVVASLSFVLLGCSHSKKDFTVKKAPTLSVKQQRSLLRAAMAASDIQLVEVGQTERLILPSDYFFRPGSSNLYHRKKNVLSDVAAYIKSYAKVSVEVKGYSDNVESGRFQQALSAKQASVVSRILWDKGVNTRFIAAEGVGKKDRVDTNKTAAGRFANRRIEISFQYRKAYTYYD